MSKYLPSGERLKEERERLRHNQTVCAELGGVTRKTLFNYESGDTPLSGAFLLAIAEHGYDSPYILFGRRFAQTPEEALVLTPDERRLIDRYRTLSVEARRVIDRMAELESTAQPGAPIPSVKSPGKLVIKGNGNVVGKNNQTTTTIVNSPKAPRKSPPKNRT